MTLNRLKGKTGEIYFFVRKQDINKKAVQQCTDVAKKANLKVVFKEPTDKFYGANPEEGKFALISPNGYMTIANPVDDICDMLTDNITLRVLRGELGQKEVK